MGRVDQIDVLFHSVLARFFTIPARQPVSGAVTFAQMRVLWLLEFHKSAAAGVLARGLGVSDSTATELVDRLVRGGYVRRGPSPDDRRRVILSLRPRGRAMLADFAQRRRERFQKLFRLLRPREIRRMARALETLNEVLAHWQGK
jgi:DNA-binding MarR family transcriptional regulator